MPAEDVDSSFKEVPGSDWAYAAVDRLQRQGLIKGYPFGYFSGKRILTRYEFGVAIQRAVSMIYVPSMPQATPGRATQPHVDEQVPTGSPTRAEELKLLRKLHLQFKMQVERMGEDWNTRDRVMQQLQDLILRQYLVEALAAGIPKNEDAPPGPGFSVVKRPHWAYDALKQLRHAKEALQIPEDRLLARTEFTGIVDRAGDSFVRADRPPLNGNMPVVSSALYDLTELIALHRLTHAFRFEIASTGRDPKAIEALLAQVEEKRITDEETFDTQPPVLATTP